ncbi:hypothetical protein [Companilactobacillus kedongensis]|uniref:hypothetical protein n=1 Tax=Companilactobacillus kedongensis TaxID=2486004 RepID=UPI000F7723E8|nr:hypothetical protein [Companilactobacillus kedongensis]
MKKRYLAVILFLILLISGCSSSNGTNRESSKTDKETETYFFNKISSENSSNVKFSFKKNTGTIVDSSTIDLTITNQSNKNIKFDLNEFILLSADDIHSAKSGIKIIKPNKKITIKKLFQDVETDVLENPGLFVYKNDNFKLAYLNPNNDTFSSNNLKNRHLKNDYKDYVNQKGSTTVDSNKSNNSTTNENSNNNDTSSDNDSVNATSDTKSNVVNSEGQAMALVEKQNGPAIDDESYSYNSGMWDTASGKSYWVILTKPNPDAPDIQMPMGSWMVYPDGTIVSGRPTGNSN